MWDAIERRRVLRAGGIVAAGALAGCDGLGGGGTPLTIRETSTTLLEIGIPRIDVTVENTGSERARGKLTGTVTTARDRTVSQHRSLAVAGDTTRTIPVYVIPEYGILPEADRPISGEASLEASNQPVGPTVDDPGPVDPVDDGGWPTSHYDGGNTRYDPTVSAPASAPGSEPSTVWTDEDVTGLPDGGPVVVDGRVYGGDPVWGFDAETGEVLHRFDDLGRRSNLVVSDGVLAFWSESDAVGVDLASGDVAWRVSPTWEVGRYGITRTGGELVLLEGISTGSTRGGRVRGVDPASGDVTWSADLPTVPTLPAAADGTVFTAADSTLRAISAGETDWTYDLSSPASYPASVAHDTVFQPVDDGRLDAVATDDGTRRWTTWLVDTPEYPPAVTEDLVVAGPGAWEHGGVVSAVDVVTGVLQWSTRLDRRPSTAVTVVGDVALLGTTDGTIVGLSLSDGSQQFDVDVGDRNPAGAMAAVDDRLYVTDYFGALLALE